MEHPDNTELHQTADVFFLSRELPLMMNQSLIETTNVTVFPKFRIANSSTGNLFVVAGFVFCSFAFTNSIQAQTDRIEQMRQEQHERVRKMREDSSRRFDKMRENSDQRLEAMRNGSAFENRRTQERSSSRSTSRGYRRLIRWGIGALIVGAIGAWKILTRKDEKVVPIDFPKN